MLETTPKVSVCIVTYNQEQYIRQCLQSVVDQEVNFPIEVIVSDDCSTDRTPEIIKEFADKYSFIKPVLRDKNIGAFKNFVETHNMATGEYVCHLDGDDYWYSSKLEKQVALMESDEYVVSWCKMDFIDEEKNLMYPGDALDYSIFKNKYITIDNAFRLGSFGIHSSILYKRTARKTRNPDFKTLDVFYTWEFLYSGKGGILEQVLGAYRLNSATSISKSNILERLTIVKHHLNYYLQIDKGRKKDIFIMAITNMLIEIKNMRASFLIFIPIIINTICVISISDLLNHFNEIKKISFPPKTMPIKYK